MTSTTSVLVAGDTLIDLVPTAAGPPSTELKYEPSFGGSAANVAVGLARLGQPPLLWTRLATDDFGSALKRELIDSAIPDKYLIADSTAQTTLAVVTHDETGDRSFGFYRGAGPNTRLQRGVVSDTDLEMTTWVHTTGVTLSVEPSRSSTLELQRRATKKTTVSLDPNWRPEMWESADTFAAVIRGALTHVDVVKATPEDFSAAGFDTSDHKRLCRRVSEYGPHTVLLTLGQRGAICYGTENSPVSGVTTHSGYDVAVQDTTGAGDVFSAGFIAGMSNGETDPYTLLSIANAAGAATTTQPGAVTALTGVETIEDIHGPLPWATGE